MIINGEGIFNFLSKIIYIYKKVYIENEVL